MQINSRCIQTGHTPCEIHTPRGQMKTEEKVRYKELIQVRTVADNHSVSDLNTDVRQSISMRRGDNSSSSYVNSLCPPSSKHTCTSPSSRTNSGTQPHSYRWHLWIKVTAGRGAALYEKRGPRRGKEKRHKGSINWWLLRSSIYRSMDSDNSLAKNLFHLFRKATISFNINHTSRHWISTTGTPERGTRILMSGSCANLFLVVVFTEESRWFIGLASFIMDGDPENVVLKWWLCNYSETNT